MKKVDFPLLERKKQKAVLAFSAFLLILPSCGSPRAISNQNNRFEADSVTMPSPLSYVKYTFSDDDLEDYIGKIGMTTISLRKEARGIYGEGASFEGGVLTFNKTGVYIVSGPASQIVIDAPETDTVRLILAGADIENSEGPALWAKSAQKAIVTLKSGTSNSLKANGHGPAVLSEGPITFNGAGSASISGGDGIYSLGDLKIANGNIAIDALNYGAASEASVSLALCSLYVTAGKDAIASLPSKQASAQAEKGYIYWASGSLVCKAGGDGVSADTNIVVSNGAFDIASGAINEGGAGFRAKNGDISFVAGRTSVQSSGPCIYSAGLCDFYDGFFELSSGGAAISAGGAFRNGKATVRIKKSKAGIVSRMFDSYSGRIEIEAEGAGIDIANNQGPSDPKLDLNPDGSGLPYGVFQGDSVISIHSKGPSVSSEGGFAFEGGKISLSSGEGAVKANMGASLSGSEVSGPGKLGAVDEKSSHQPVLAIGLNKAWPKGSKVCLKAANSNKEACSFEALSDFSSVFFSSPGLKPGGKYQLYIDGAQIGGIYQIEGVVTEYLQ